MSVEQLSLLDDLASGPVGVPYQSGSATSKAAAEKIAPKVSRLEGYVLDALYSHPDGLTDEELDAVVEYVSTLRPRRIGLSQPKYKDRDTFGGLIREILRPALVEQTQRQRRTRFGNLAYVHKLSAEGRTVAEERTR